MTDFVLHYFNTLKQCCLL